MRIYKVWIGLAAVALSLFALGTVQAQQLQAGKDYQLLTPPQPTQSGKNVEVIEFFWYGCPHCARLQPSLRAWRQKKPADVTFRSQPAAFDEGWTQLARAFYAMEVLGVQEKLHGALFEAIHTKHALDPRVLLKDPKTLFEWMGAQGVDPKKYADAYNSFAVVSKTQRTVDLTSAYDIKGTPTLVVDGRYLLTVTDENNYDQFFKNLDQLIAMARAQHKGK